MGAWHNKNWCSNRGKLVFSPAAVMIRALYCFGTVFGSDQTVAYIIVSVAVDINEGLSNNGTSQEQSEDAGKAGCCCDASLLAYY
jgi:hypothetical protein